MVGKFLVFILLSFFIIRIVRLLLFFCEFWQRKEYRVDRVISHLKTKQGLRLLFNPSSLINWLILFSFPLFIISSLSITYFLLVTGIFVSEGLYSLSVLMKGKWRIPRFGLRTISILLSALLFISLCLVYVPLSLPLILLVIDRISGLLISLLFLLSSLPFFLYEKVLIEKAKKKMEQVQPIVIGITGSYGKTSTKEFLYQILKEDYRVVKTPKSQNTSIGIAETIVRSVHPTTKIFIVEMGAYKKGEISKIAKLVKPAFAIITGLNEQHMELFGSIENTMRAKYELVENLLPSGKVIMSANNSYLRTMAKWAKKDGKQVIFYKSDTQQSSVSFYTSFVLATKKNIRFCIHLQKFEENIIIPIIGKHQSENLLTAATTAYLLGIKPHKIVAALKKIEGPAKTMQLLENKQPAYWVDDSYNSNPEAVRAVLEYMKQFRGNRILILQPLIELGEKVNEVHTKLGEETSRVCTTVVLTNNNYYSAFAKNFDKGKKKAKLFLSNQINSANLVTELKSANDVIVFEGREAGSLLLRLT